MSDYLKYIINKTVVGIDVSQDQYALRLRCSDGAAVVWQTYGECCSESWWADAFQLNQLRGATVTDAAEIEMPTPTDARERSEIDENYGVKLTTTQGVCDLVFRNSSNGYYGGWCELASDSDRFVWTELVGNDWSSL